MPVLFSRSMLNNILDKIRLPFRKEKELYLSLYNITGFIPRDIQYYKLALMHKSISHNNKNGKALNNERLEFLGDAVLGSVVGTIVYQHFPKKREGFLTDTRSKIVQRETLNKLADKMGLIQLVKSSCKNGNNHNNYMGGNAFEALVGALYLDRGYDACMKFVNNRILGDLIDINKIAYKEINFKSKLLEWGQKNHIDVTFNELEEKTDESGSPVFRYNVFISGIEGADGIGFTKKESQQVAAKATLKRLKEDPYFIDSIFSEKDKTPQTT